MTKEELIKKADTVGLTADEVKEYQKLVKPEKHIYGKYGTLAKIYLAEHNPAKEWSIENLPEYLHNIDKQASEMYDIIYAKLSKQPRFQKSSDFMKNLQAETEMQNIINEEILNELVYVD